MGRFLYQLWKSLLPLQLILIMGAIGLMAGLTGAMIIILLRGELQPPPAASLRENPAPPVIARKGIAPVFTPEVQYWAPQIVVWARQYGVDADILATVIQIESCGDYLVESPAGAKGLFQVMPFHFTSGEDMTDPNTNAKRGIAYLKGGLKKADGHIGLAMAGYNGGWGMIDRGWGGWFRETKLYYMWGSEIYLDALAGKQPNESASLQSWLNAGGINLCRQASARIAGTLLPPTPVPLPGQTAQAQPTVQPTPPLTSQSAQPTAIQQPPLQPTVVILPAR